jgi:hypothetical protein
MAAMRGRVSLIGSAVVLAGLCGASNVAAATSQGCALISPGAPSLSLLARGARLALGPASSVAGIRVSTPPPRYWGHKLGPHYRTITPHSPWVYVSLRKTDTNVEQQRAFWQASVLIQSLHAAVCGSGRRPESGDSIVRAGKAAVTTNEPGPTGRGPQLPHAPFATVDAAFRARLAAAATTYGFQVRSLVVLHADGDAPQIEIESDSPKDLIPNIAAIDQSLAPPGTSCATIACFTGFYLEGDDSTGTPFLQLSQLTTLPEGVAVWGSQWVAPGLPYPFVHG